MKIKPEKEERVVKLFGSVSRARILSLLVAHAGRSFYQREIMYETDLSLRPVQRELMNLLALGIIGKQMANNRVPCCAWVLSMVSASRETTNA
jgi:predicted DNA-binding transcriptional regulator